MHKILVEGNATLCGYQQFRLLEYGKSSRSSSKTNVKIRDVVPTQKSINQTRLLESEQNLFSFQRNFSGIKLKGSVLANVVFTVNYIEFPILTHAYKH